MRGETIILTHHEQQRLMVLSALDRGELLMADAAALLGRSVRQVRRLRQAYRTRGPTALAHGNRGRPSPRRVAESIRAQVVALAQTTYAGVNHTHLLELLGEREHLRLSRTTLRRILTAAGLRTPRRHRPRRHRQRRPRMPRAGMLVQVDGSHHAWLEDRGPRLVLHAAIDDATGEVLAAVFRDEEGAAGYLVVFREIARTRGLPLAVYSDRHGIFARTPRRPLTLAEQLQGGPAPTQVGRALQEAGIRWIPAASPQAKGRIETLFGHLQDRLVSELRLAGITHRDEANAFLPGFLTRYNARFAQPSPEAEPAYRPWAAGLDPNTVFCCKYRRTVANDNTVALGPHRIQLLPGPQGRSFAKAHVEVHERLDGQVAVFYQGHRLATRPLTAALALEAPARDYDRVHPLEAGHPRPRGGSQVSPSLRKSRPGGSGEAAARPRQPSAPTEPRSPDADHPWRRTVLTKTMKREIETRRTNSLVT